MKRLLPFLLALLLLAPALAEDDPEALFRNAHSLYSLEQYACHGDTAAAIMIFASSRTLCVAERIDGEWVMTVDNHEALRTGYDYRYALTVQEDSVLEWRCEGPLESGSTCEIWRSKKTDAGWAFPTMTDRYEHETLRIDTRYRWQDGLLTRVEELQIGEDQPPVITELMPLPAGWTRDMTTLADFDLITVPLWIPSYAFSGYIEGPAVMKAAKELLPNYAYLGGQLCGDSLHFLLKRPDGARVFVGVTWDGEWRFTESTPLPKECEYFALYHYCELNMPHAWQLDLAPDRSGSWGVDYLVSYAGNDECPFYIRAHLLTPYNTIEGPALIVGEHPWGDITTIDWASLPVSVEDAWAKIDTAGWAMVHDPIDNFAVLYAMPEREALSLGEYRTGTPARVLERQDGWTQVDIGGVQGFMETACLAFGDKMAAVDSYLRYLSEVVYTDTSLVDFFPTPDGEPACAIPYGGMVILGDCGEAWYHVYDIATDQYGYVRHDPPHECPAI